MAAKPLPDQALLLKLLRYEPETGRLFWLPRAPEMFASCERFSPDSRANQWNSRYAGKEAFTAFGARGYLTGMVMGRSLLAHRVIWKMVTGEDPDEIDHISGERANNRFANLRAVDHRQNSRNRGVSTKNTSGSVGVHWCRRRKTWKAQIRANGDTHYLGHFQTKEAAVLARKSAERRMDFHPNHGRKRKESK